MRLPKVLDNKKYRVIDELKAELRKGSKLSIISAYFTIYAYEELKKELSKIDSLRFIFTEPTFVRKDQELIREYYIVHNPENGNAKSVPAFLWLLPSRYLRSFH